MRRYVFYLAVALVCFGIGLLGAFKFPRVNAPPPKVKETVKTESNIQKVNPVGHGFGVGDSDVFANTYKNPAGNKKPKITCTNKKLLPLWKALKKDKDFREMAKNFFKDGDCTNLIDVQKVDLNDNRQKEFVVWGSSFNLCGVTGNCPLWIYEKKNGKYKLLLRAGAYNGETKWFEVKKAKSKGYRNLLLKGHFTGYETTHSFYKFNGAKYVETKCWFEIYSLNEEKPAIMTCKEYSEQTERELRESEKQLKNQ